jgi:hypothetical protein
MSKKDSERERTPAVGCVALDDWTPIQVTLSWYRFGKLTQPGNRTLNQIPLGGRWVFETALDFETGVMLLGEQNHNPSIDRWIRRLVFYKRFLDPVALPVARLFCRCLFWVLPPSPRVSSNCFGRDVPMPETSEHTAHLYVVRSPTTGLVEWSNSAALHRDFYCATVHERKADAECSDPARP